MTFKKWFAAKQKGKSQGNTSEKITKEAIMQAFDHCDDVFQKTCTFYRNTQAIEVFIVYCQGLCHQEKLNDEVIPELERIIKESAKLNSDTVMTHWKRYPLTTVKNMEQLITDVFTGKLIFSIQGIAELFVVDIADPPQRTPEESRTEISIRGPRDGFIEDIRVNTALIRKRISSNCLRYEEFIIGRRSKTRVGLLYIDDIASPNVINQVREQLKGIDIDALLNANQLEELLIAKRTRLFPMFHYSGRPDFVTHALLNGRFALLIDGAPTVLLAPVNLTYLLKTGEDNEVYFIYNSAERLLRTFALVVAITIPGFWVALITFHQNQLPFILLVSLGQIRQGIPLPSHLEAFTMLIIFELFREAGQRLPTSVGQTLSVVGGLIIGDAAIRAGLTNPDTIVVIATSVVATFSLVNHSLIGTIVLLRIYIMALSSFLGMFGFLVATFSILIYLANLRSYGIPYLFPVAPLHFRDMLNSIFRTPWKVKDKRPAFVKTNEDVRQGKKK